MTDNPNAFKHGLGQDAVRRIARVSFSQLPSGSGTLMSRVSPVTAPSTV